MSAVADEPRSLGGPRTRRSASARSSGSTASTSTCAAARCSRCSATTAPGKSTLIKCLSGVLRLDRGAIEMDGEPVTIHSPADARALGIETVYQDLALFDNLRPSDNFYAGRELAAPAVAAALAPRFSSAARWPTTTRATLERLQVDARRSTAPSG